MNIKMQVNKTGERIVREYWDPKSEDLVSIFCINVKSIGQDDTFNSKHLKPMILGFRDSAKINMDSLGPGVVGRLVLY